MYEAMAATFIDTLGSIWSRRRPAPVECDGKFNITLSGMVGSYMHDELVDQYQTCPDDANLVIKLTTNGGDLASAIQIAKVLQSHPGQVTVHVPRYAMSAGTIIALSADKIILGTSACMGGIDGYIYGVNIPVATAVVNKAFADQAHLTLAERHTWLSLFTSYSQKMLGKMSVDHTRMIRAILEDQYGDRADAVYQFFTHANHHNTPIFAGDIPADLDLVIEVNDYREPRKEDPVTTEIIDSPPPPRNGGRFTNIFNGL